MNNPITRFFSTDNFMPHGHCYLWEPVLLWLHVVSDSLIAIAYFSIPVTLLFFVRKRKDLQFHWMFICFAIFILACGASHVMEVWTVWTPAYWLSGGIKAITALVSIPTAFLLVKLIPLALALPSPAALAASNEQLRQEIADRTRIEAALSKKNLELASLNEELRAFSYSVSHDLRTPLRSLDGFSLALLEDYSDKLDADGQDALRRIRMASQRMGRLIDDMLRLSQVTRSEIRPEPIDLSALCNGIVATLSEAQPQRSVQWQVDPGMQLQADKGLIGIVMQNLIENAWKFTGRTDQPAIHIGARNIDGNQVFFVADNGAGFDMLHAEKLFGTFERLHAVSDFTGTGIGLALVKRIIRRHEGEIWAEARVGLGATFYFCMKEDRDVLSA
ncbi:ATP-binding protein [Actimicrobium sp. CCC2.4]|uniref:sensor histidine kinase n=1 Tax=Actimicrobium sp. CCC2.4 TaxID=3048606 RepID=UPI002AC8E9F1|nr:ATP-binding protein [Actimicrobium sp. CCC2.4]MEB0136497.1 ATP-binding protein [Actimicrobium sp. CCC2.4]WPX30858.1 ATP-binding protein [Actimicrobium sp. CCC2.4]